eukprot:CAMPEP_0197526442 /NCGR_PEP_ID=MMETSP1318-20131121/17834_1 /TAXON_ID=552666 /ORGANISM="Partenskyella glossopodia, Strain RCC365" /LENGTH=413 /DNA_ID=CAMNT_0043080605 /DNA_START=465 /DNA_END=1706 /DNA_ORIENTATION=+
MNNPKSPKDHHHSTTAASSIFGDDDDANQILSNRNGDESSSLFPALERTDTDLLSTHMPNTHIPNNDHMRNINAALCESEIVVPGRGSMRNSKQSHVDASSDTARRRPSRTAFRNSTDSTPSQMSSLISRTPSTNIKPDYEARQQQQANRQSVLRHPLDTNPIPEERKQQEAELLLNEGYNLFNGIDFKTINKQKGQLLIQEAARLGSECARGMCFQQGCAEGGISLEKALMYYRKAATNGHALANVQLGNCYHVGHGVELDHSRAVGWYRKAASMGNATGQRCLGSCYHFGHGVQRDFRLALKWYKKSALQGHCVALYSLGYCYERGIGVGQDLEKAAKYMLQSASQGYVPAEKDLENIISEFPEIEDKLRAWQDALYEETKQQDSNAMIMSRPRLKSLWGTTTNTHNSTLA